MGISSNLKGKPWVKCSIFSPFIMIYFCEGKANFTRIILSGEKKVSISKIISWTIRMSSDMTYLSLEKYIYTSVKIFPLLSIMYSCVWKNMQVWAVCIYTHTQRSVYLDSQAYCFGEHNMSIMAVTIEIQYRTQQAVSNKVSATEL